MKFIIFILSLLLLLHCGYCWDWPFKYLISSGDISSWKSAFDRNKESLYQRIYIQTPMLDKIYRSITNFNEGKEPIILHFYGPVASGKTFVAKDIAQTLFHRPKMTSSTDIPELMMVPVVKKAQHDPTCREINKLRLKYRIDSEKQCRHLKSKERLGCIDKYLPAQAKKMQLDLDQCLLTYRDKQRRKLQKAFQQQQIRARRSIVIIDDIQIWDMDVLSPVFIDIARDSSYGDFLFILTSNIDPNVQKAQFNGLDSTGNKSIHHTKNSDLSLKKIQKQFQSLLKEWKEEVKVEHIRFHYNKMMTERHMKHLFERLERDDGFQFVDNGEFDAFIPKITEMFIERFKKTRPNLSNGRLTEEAFRYYVKNQLPYGSQYSDLKKNLFIEFIPQKQLEKAHVTANGKAATPANIAIAGAMVNKSEINAASAAGGGDSSSTPVSDSEAITMGQLKLYWVNKGWGFQEPTFHLIKKFVR